MRNVAPLTKLALTVMVSCWALLLDTVTGLSLLVACQLILFPLSGVPGKSYRALAGIVFFAALLAAMQAVLGAGLEFSIMIGLRMMAMTSIFVLLLATTRIQDLTAALVRQLKVPAEYAFMFTAALRFIPDFLAEVKAVQEAQACRGYSPKGSITKRLINYLSVVQPMVLRAVARSETIAMSLEMRGFGRARTGGYGASVALTGIDYVALCAMLAVTAAILALKLR